VILAATLVGLSIAQPAVRSTQPTDSVPGSELTVYLLTFDPGPLIWERFGHNALWIRDNRTGTNQAYDYGRFSFGRTTWDLARFIGRFARGDLLYSMGGGDAYQVYIAGYTAAGRSIWSQELDLPPAARQALRDFLEINYRPENRAYQYNYYLDNCSTRIRDAIDRVVGGQLKTWAEGVATEATYRDHTRRTTENGAVVYTALMLGLGQPVDRPLTAWEEMFLPISLRPYLNQVSIRDPDGRVHGLVKEERHLVSASRFSVASRPTDLARQYLLVGVLVGVLLALLGRLGSSHARWRVGFGTCAVVWALLAGIGGTILAGLWAGTSHRFSYSNENLFQLNLLSLALALVLPSAVSKGQRRRQLGLILATGVAALSLLGLALKLVPGFIQSNLDMIALIAPIHLGLLAGLAASHVKPSGAA
jgi:hypothetical protein